MVDKPTRGNNILDLVCISDLSCIDKLVVEESFALSDHKSINVLLRCPVVRITSHHPEKFINFILKSQLLGNKQIKNTDWTNEYNNKSMTEM